MAIRMRDPFSALLAMQRALDRTTQSDWLGGRISGRGAYPPINAFRQGEDFVIVAELPGVRKEDLDVSVKGDEIRIVGDKKIGHDEDSSVHRRERSAGKFDRTLQIPAHVDSSNARAEFRDGLLALHLPLAEKEKARPIAIS